MRFCGGTLHPEVRPVNNETLFCGGKRSRRTNGWILVSAGSIPRQKNRRCLLDSPICVCYQCAADTDITER